MKKSTFRYLSERTLMLDIFRYFYNIWHIYCMRGNLDFNYSLVSSNECSRCISQRRPPPSSPISIVTISCSVSTPTPPASELSKCWDIWCEIILVKVWLVNLHKLYRRWLAKLSVSDTAWWLRSRPGEEDRLVSLTKSPNQSTGPIQHHVGQFVQGELRGRRPFETWRIQVRKLWSDKNYRHRYAVCKL